MAPTTRNTQRVHEQPNSNQPRQGSMDDVADVHPLNELETGTEEIATSRKKRSRARGPTFMCKVWGQRDDDRIKVLFNDKGQPIFNHSTLSHFLGTLARNGKYAPLHYISWHKMPVVYKNDMLALVLQKFDISLGHKKLIFKSISKKWRNWKATVKRTNFDPDLSIEEQIHSPPDRVQADQWKELVKYWHGDAKVGDYAYFKSVANPIEFVGKGRIASMNPSTQVGGEELGANWCEIHVLLPIQWDEHLIRPYGGLKTIGDAIGTPIAWPISLVEKDDDGCFTE